jgi:hypothetical protein
MTAPIDRLAIVRSLGDRTPPTLPAHRSITPAIGAPIVALRHRSIVAVRSITGPAT